jgi:hypothetical protein
MRLEGDGDVAERPRGAVRLREAGVELADEGDFIAGGQVAAHRDTHVLQPQRRRPSQVG